MQGSAEYTWNAGCIWFRADGVKLHERILVPGFDNLLLDRWYRWSLSFDLDTNKIVQAAVTDLATNDTSVYEPTDRYLPGGDIVRVVDPTAILFYSVGNEAVVAVDNVSVEPVAATP
jgi:hypothetical protein